VKVRKKTAWNLDEERHIAVMKVLLLATWFVQAQPPVPFQAEFSSREACTKAVSDLREALAKATDVKGALVAACVEK
jgi:hypothetical protein